MGRGKSKINGKYDEYHSNGESIDGVKVIESNNSKNAPLPRYSAHGATMYILKSGGRYKCLGIYGADRELKKVIDVTHSHTNRPKSGKKEKLKIGVAHVHNIRGGRENNVRYMTKKEIKKYGSIIRGMGGKLKP